MKKQLDNENEILKRIKYIITIIEFLIPYLERKIIDIDSQKRLKRLAELKKEVIYTN